MPIASPSIGKIQNRRVALKILTTTVGSDVMLLTRFQIETRDRSPAPYQHCAGVRHGGLGGKALTAADVKALATGQPLG